MLSAEAMKTEESKTLACEAFLAVRRMRRVASAELSGVPSGPRKRIAPGSERQVADHREHPAKLRDQAGDAGERLEAVLKGSLGRA